MTSSLTHIVAVFSILSLSIPVPAIAQSTISDEVRDELEALVDVTRDLQDVVAEYADLVDVLLTQTGRKADALRDFVGGSIAYVPYTGVLRGAVGTLRSGVGNSYDQSLTLITLMKHAGYEGQILVGDMSEILGSTPTFSTEQSSLIVPDGSEDIDELAAEIAEISDEIATLSGRAAVPLPQTPPAAALDNNLAATAASQAAALLQMPVATTSGENQTIYAIVRYREGATQNWVYFDPARNVTLEDVDITSLTVLGDRIPDEHSHKLNLTLAAQSETFGTVAIAQSEITVANLNNRSLSFSLVPSGDVFAPDIVQTFAPDQSIAVMSDVFPSMVVSLSGQALSLEDASNSMGAVFQTGAGLLGDAMATLQNEDVTEAQALDRIVLNISTRGPGSEVPITAQRVLLDRRAVAEAIAEGLPFETTDPLRSGMLAAATGTYLIYAGTAPLTQAETTAQDVAGLANILDQLVAAPEQTFETGSKNVSRMLVNQIAGIFKEDVDVGVFHTGASVAVLKTVTAPSDNANAVARSFQSDIVIDGRFSAMPERSMQWAVDAAGVEAQLVSRMAQALEYTYGDNSSYAALQTLIAAGVTPVTVDDYLSGLSASGGSVMRDQQREFLERQIANGKLVAVWPDADFTKTAWLEFDPATHQARLASNDGAGQMTTEELLLNINIALYLTIVNIANCAKNASSSSKAATARCLGCASVKFSLAIVGLGTLSFAQQVVMGGLAMNAEISCL